MFAQEIFAKLSSFSCLLIRFVVCSTLGLLVNACSDPAPGAALDHPTADKTLPKIVSAKQAIEHPDLPKIDPTTLDTAEINKVLSSERRCVFSYTSTEAPIMAATTDPDGAGKGVLKIHGRLVELVSDETRTFEQLMNGGTFKAGSIEFEVRVNEKNKDQADAIFRIEEELTVGYGGYYRCQTEV